MARRHTLWERPTIDLPPPYHRRLSFSMDEATSSPPLSLSPSIPSTPSSPRSGSQSDSLGLGSACTSACSSPILEPVKDEYVLVVGGLGYIGSHTTWEFIKEGYNIAIIDNLDNSYRTAVENLEELSGNFYKGRCKKPSIKFHEADYRDEDVMRNILSQYQHCPGLDLSAPNNRGNHMAPQSRIKGVIHFAAHKSVPESIEQPLKYYSNNVSGLVTFCGMLGEFGIKSLVFSSSATVYGELANKGGRIPETSCVHETTLTQECSGEETVTFGGCTGLTNPYGRSKWMCEAILHDLAASDPEWNIVALRYFNPIGCDPSGKLGESSRTASTSLFSAVMNVMNKHQSHLSIFGADWDSKDGSPIRDFIHVSDLARGHLSALFSACRPEQAGFRTYNVGTGTGYTVREVVDTMEIASGQRIPTVEVGRRHGDVGICIAEPSRLRQDLGWESQKSLMDCCQDLCRFLGIRESDDAFLKAF